MTQPKLTALAVEDYLKRTIHSKASVKLTTVDSLNRVGSVVIYRGDLWSARDNQGVGELALLRLMNERVALHVESLSELDRGPRTITERRHVLFMRASFESQAALDNAGDAPTSTRLPRPTNTRPTNTLPTESLPTESLPEPPTLVANPKVAPPKPVRTLPPLRRPLEMRGSDAPAAIAFPNEPEAPTLIATPPTPYEPPRESTKLSPTTLQPLTFDTETEATQTSRSSSIDPPLTQTPGRRPRTLGTAWQVAAVVVLGSAVGVSLSLRAAVSAVQPVPNEPAAASSALNDIQRETLPSHLPDGTGNDENRSLGADSLGLPGTPVVRVRAVRSSESLGGIDLQRYVYSASGQFMRCYDWATARAERGALGKVSVTVQLNGQGAVHSSVATGAKIRGLNTCVADVAARLPELMRVPQTTNTLNWVLVFEQK